MNKKIFAERLIELMSETNLTYTDLAELCATTRQAISCYATGKNIPRVDKVILLAERFGVSTDYLLGLSDVKTTDMELKGVCEYIGLKENTILRIRKMHMKDKVLFERLICAILEIYFKGSK